MSVTKLLSDLSRLEISVRAVGQRLRCSPRSALTPDIVYRIARQKRTPTASWL